MVGDSVHASILAKQLEWYIINSPSRLHYENFEACADDARLTPLE